MRSFICVVIMLALIGLTGCAKKDPIPTEQHEAQTESQPISSEDFESGDVEGVVGDGDEVVEQTSEGADQEDTP